ncbi:hypothetical protein [Fulvivirga sediminis]|uniref:Uncharacterized protein n=1 Tax=Fulvivirga sediminis TaxID=2803949 RepID=A0A937K2T7_9BACT|nr:hypothetical protein [Fulvivirga sediminis]MBL3658961.1 hypothetical protein [Fulvivirga sediminis]
MRLDKITIREIKFEWGDLLSDVKSQLSTAESMVENENPYSNSSTLKIPLTDIWSISTNSCEFSSPDSDRLINNVSINISAKDNTKDSVLEAMQSQLGPTSTERNGDRYGSGSVIKNCTWKYDNCQIGVSLYGGIRKERGEESIGIIYIHLEDIELLDSLYTKRLKEIESDLSTRVNINSIDSFKMAKKQWITWSMENHKYPSLSPNFISRALNGFYKREIFKTPEQVQSNINEYEVSIWKSTSDEYYLSNYWETVRLTKSINTSWVNAKPAKGGGYCHISIGNLSINNEHSLPESKALVNRLEELMNIEIKCHQDYDC